MYGSVLEPGLSSVTLRDLLLESKYVQKNTRCEVFDTNIPHQKFVRLRIKDLFLSGYIDSKSLAPSFFINPDKNQSFMAKHQVSLRPLYTEHALPNPNDVHQGLIRDCSFMASLSQIARRYPKFIKTMMCETPNGVEVNYFNKHGDKQKVLVQKTYLKKQQCFFFYTDYQLYHHYTKPLWATIAEKAYAFSQINKTYSEIHTTKPRQALTWLTGCRDIFSGSLQPTANIRMLCEYLHDLHKVNECIIIHHCTKHAYELVDIQFDPDEITISCSASLDLRTPKIQKITYRNFYKTIIGITHTQNLQKHLSKITIRA